MKLFSLLQRPSVACALAATVLAAWAGPAHADVRVPKIFSNQMLLQRGLDAPVWGWAEPGEMVVVKFGDQQHQTKADEQGKWIVRLEPMAASADGRPLTISGNNEVSFQNVIVGDVWICSGQSNMEWPTSASLNAKEEVDAADFPAIRLFDVPGHTTSPVAKDDVPGGQWQECSAQSVGGFSAVGYFFARHIHREAGVPVGLIGTNWGGTRIEPWVPPVGFRGVPELAKIAESVDKFDPATPSGKETWTAYVDSVRAWTEAAKEQLSQGAITELPPAAPGFSANTAPTAIYNSMVHGLAPYGVRGAVWYQGESNGSEGIEYYHKMRALIEGWRQVWNQKNFPLYFYYVQLADFQADANTPEGGDGWARLREAQLQSLAIKHTGMAVITDIGQADDIHPRNKQDVGKRLALWALRDVAEQDVVVSGPLYREMKIEGNHIRLSFDHVGDGLMVGKRKNGLEDTMEEKDAPLKRFSIAGDDKKWVWADAKIDGDAVVVSSDEVAKPVAVRYGYTMNPVGANLYNRNGLPASPFRTDNW